MSDLERLKIEDLNVGDKVCIAYQCSYGWSNFRYSLYREDVVERITPKKTKVVLSKYGDCDRHTHIYKISDETRRRTKVGSKFISILRNLNELQGVSLI